MFATSMLMLLESFHSAAAISRLVLRHSSRARATSGVDIDQIDLNTIFLLLYYLQPTCYALAYLILSGDRDRKCPEEQDQLRSLLRP